MQTLRTQLNSSTCFSDPPLNFALLEPDLAGYRGQFVIARDLSKLPKGWKVSTFRGWNLAVNDLPVQSVRTEDGTEIGWCLGHPIADWQRPVLQHAGAVDDFYQATAGTFLLVLFNGNEGQVYLDPYGCLPAVYSEVEEVVASTPTLIEGAVAWDHDAIRAVGFPEATSWLPFGMTARKGVRRALPNHRLSLSKWTIERHWPRPNTDLSIVEDVDAAVDRIANNMVTTLQRAAYSNRLTFTLTAGRDSRIILASAREVAPDADFITFAHGGKTRDSHIAALLARTTMLRHRLMPVVNASDKQIREWLYRTGHSIGGAIMEVHPTLEGLDPHRVLVQGIAGEVGRGRFWKKGDRDDQQLTAGSVLQRLVLPDNPLLREAADRWLSDLPNGGTFLKLDLLFIEQRLACWGALSTFGNVRSIFEFTPFNDRKVFTDMMRLPHQYRWNERLTRDICMRRWPELLTVPFNRFTGIRGVFDILNEQAKQVVKSVLYRGGL